MSADSAYASAAGAALATTLAQFAHGLRRGDVAEQAASHAAMLILDALGCALADWAAEETPQVLSVARALGGANVSVTAIQREMGLRYQLKAERRPEGGCATPMGGSRSPPWTGASPARISRRSTSTFPPRYRQSHRQRRGRYLPAAFEYAFYYEKLRGRTALPVAALREDSRILY